jgi:hypothetical protein
MKQLFESIREAAVALLANTETLTDGEITDILSHEEVQEMETYLWEMVEMVQCP